MDGAVGGFAREDYLHDGRLMAGRRPKWRRRGNRLAVERRATLAAATPVESDTYTIAPGTNRLTAIAGAAGTRALCTAYVFAC